MNLKERLIENRERLYSYDEKFYKIFHVHISNFQDSLMLFDVVKFDEVFIKSREKNMSCQDAVREEYGIAGERLIKEILEMPTVNKVKKIKKIRKEKV